MEIFMSITGAIAIIGFGFSYLAMYVTIMDMSTKIDEILKKLEQMEGGK